MIGKNIIRIRKKKGMTLSELAERAEISKSYLSNIERNRNRNPSIQVLEKISAVLEVDLQKLLATDRKPEVPIVEQEWQRFVNRLKASGVDKNEIKDYKTLMEFIKWRNDQDRR
ncbi:helix-turn-helix domain-containing protein [Camelliibacillus cellulosilyticus]|uniref:Helix-turn-helix domain-containing protein n=1 Tax=Camelliibacillus cellulosilyticus TaxID=2174486 RepID=A0ABV9GPG8_9BACL